MWSQSNSIKQLVLPTTNNPNKQSKIYCNLVLPYMFLNKTTCTHTHIWTHMASQSKRRNANRDGDRSIDHRYVLIYIYIHTLPLIYIYTHMYVYTNTHPHTHVCIYICICVCICLSPISILYLSFPSKLPCSEVKASSKSSGSTFSSMRSCAYIFQSREPFIISEGSRVWRFRWNLGEIKSPWGTHPLGTRKKAEIYPLRPEK